MAIFRCRHTLMTKGRGVLVYVASLSESGCSTPWPHCQAELPASPWALHVPSCSYGFTKTSPSASYPHCWFQLIIQNLAQWVPHRLGRRRPKMIIDNIYEFGFFHKGNPKEEVQSYMVGTMITRNSYSLIVISTILSHWSLFSNLLTGPRWLLEPQLSHPHSN